MLSIEGEAANMSQDITALVSGLTSSGQRIEPSTETMSKRRARV